MNLFLVVGPSGVGKTTLVDFTVEKLEPFYGLTRIISCTTRQPRTQEDSKKFQFLDKTAFLNNANDGYFIEYEEYAGYYYGVLKSSINQNNLIKEVTVTGMINICNYISKNRPEVNVYTIKVQTSSAQLAQRLIVNRQMSQTEIEKRTNEDSSFMNLDFNYDFIINNDNEASKQKFCDFVENKIKGENYD